MGRTSNTRSILDGYFSPLVFWYEWEYLRSPAKTLLHFLQGIWQIGHERQPLIMAKVYINGLV